MPKAYPLPFEAEVLELFRAWRAAAPGRVDRSLRLSRILWRYGHFAEAVQVLREAGREAPQSPSIPPELARREAALAALR